MRCAKCGDNAEYKWTTEFNEGIGACEKCSKDVTVAYSIVFNRPREWNLKQLWEEKTAGWWVHKNHDLSSKIRK